MTAPFAAIADVHGNSWALSAVLADIRARGIERIVNLGDTADDAMDPRGAIGMVMAEGIESIAGNYETYRDGQLSESQEAFLKALPKTRDLGDVFCCHGTPSSDTDALIEDISFDRVEIARPETIRARLGDVDHALVLCAQKHTPRAVQLPNGQLIVNPGSVGWPAYWNDVPAPHKVEAGSPHARYAILWRDAASWRVEHVAVVYPWNEAAAAARANGRPDRAASLETGRVELPPRFPSR